ncbi:MAG: hypothetical protein ACQSGP_14610 [Frankia sp.]
MITQDASPASVLGLDIENYGPRDMDGHADLQEAWRAAFHEARAKIHLPEDAATLQDHGDGGMILVRGDFSLADVVADLPRELASALGRYNRLRAPHAQMRLRVAMNHGIVRTGPHAWQGHAVVTTARILNCQAGRELLAAHPSATIIQLISERIFQDTVEEHLRDLDPSLFRPIEVGRDEKGAGLRAWARLWSKPGTAGTDAASAARGAPPSDATRAPGRSTSVGTNNGAAAFGDKSFVVGGDNHGHIQVRHGD